MALMQLVSLLPTQEYDASKGVLKRLGPAASPIANHIGACAVRVGIAVVRGLSSSNRAFGVRRTDDGDWFVLAGVVFLGPNFHQSGSRLLICQTEEMGNALSRSHFPMSSFSIFVQLR